MRRRKGFARRRRFRIRRARKTARRRTFTLRERIDGKCHAVLEQRCHFDFYKVGNPLDVYRYLYHALRRHLRSRVSKVGVYPGTASASSVNVTTHRNQLLPPPDAFDPDRFSLRVHSETCHFIIRNSCNQPLTLNFTDSTCKKTIYSIAGVGNLRTWAMWSHAFTDALGNTPDNTTLNRSTTDFAELRSYSYYKYLTGDKERWAHTPFFGIIDASVRGDHTLAGQPLWQAGQNSVGAGEAAMDQKNAVEMPKDISAWARGLWENEPAALQGDLAFDTAHNSFHNPYGQFPAAFTQNDNSKDLTTEPSFRMSKHTSYARKFWKIGRTTYVTVPVGGYIRVKQRSRRPYRINPLHDGYMGYAPWDLSYGNAVVDPGYTYHPTIGWTDTTLFNDFQANELRPIWAGHGCPYRSRCLTIGTLGTIGHNTKVGDTYEGLPAHLPADISVTSTQVAKLSWDYRRLRQNRDGYVDHRGYTNDPTIYKRWFPTSGPEQQATTDP
jgi:hypothetical protein